MVVLTMLSWLISDSPLCKGGSGGIWERLKIPLNPPFSKGDLKAFSRGLLPTADRLPGTMSGTGRTNSAKKATVCHPEPFGKLRINSAKDLKILRRPPQAGLLRMTVNGESLNLG